MTRTVISAETEIYYLYLYQMNELILVNLTGKTFGLRALESHKRGKKKSAVTELERRHSAQE